MRRITFASLVVLSPVSFAQTLEAVKSAFTTGETGFSFRYRMENVEQDSFEKSAFASTLLSRFTYKSNSLSGLSVGLEVDNISVIGAEKFNSTVNDNAVYPVVADPEATDINQYWLNYSREGISLTAGRQRINHNNQRFVGGVAWRQNEQTYDGYRGKWQASDAWELDYSYVYNINRVFGPDGKNANAPGAFHLLNSKFQMAQSQELSLFGYWLDFDENTKLSTQTFGFDYSGNFRNIAWHGAYALQQDYKENPESYTLHYWAWDISLKFDATNIFVGRESLDGDGINVFSTPLATLHKFQGFSDQFLVTPKTGVKDSYIGAGYKYQNFGLRLAYHLFEGKNTEKLGSEVDLSLNYNLSSNFSVLLKHSYYDAETHSVDTQKSWLQISYSI